MEKKELTFEEKIKELETIVTELENGNVNLDDAIKKYSRAMELSKAKCFCYSIRICFNNIDCYWYNLCCI